MEFERVDDEFLRGKINRLLNVALGVEAFRERLGVGERAERDRLGDIDGGRRNGADDGDHLGPSPGVGDGCLRPIEVLRQRRIAHYRLPPSFLPPREPGLVAA